MCRMYGRCISRLCSSSSTEGFIRENAPVLLSSSIAVRRAISALWTYMFLSLPQVGRRRQTGRGLTLEAEGNITHWRSVLCKGRQGGACDVGMMRWTEQEYSFAERSAHGRHVFAPRHPRSLVFVLTSCQRVWPCKPKRPLGQSTSTQHD